jgi:hypothetical protein
VFGAVVVFDDFPQPAADASIAARTNAASARIRVFGISPSSSFRRQATRSQAVR